MEPKGLARWRQELWEVVMGPERHPGTPAAKVTQRQTRACSSLEFRDLDQSLQRSSNHVPAFFDILYNLVFCGAATFCPPRKMRRIFTNVPPC